MWPGRKKKDTIKNIEKQSTDWGKKYAENTHLTKDCYAKNEKNSITSVIKRQTTKLKMDKKFEQLLLKRK